MLVTLADGGPDLVWAKVGVPFEGDPPTRSVSDGLRVAGLTFTMDDPLGSWRIQLEGPRPVDLTWTAITPIVDFHQGFAGDGEQEQEHFEQSGRVTGGWDTDKRREIDGWGQRDKSWGVRDWNGIEGWDWIAAQFDENLSFNATRTRINGVEQSAGYVYDGGSRPSGDRRADRLPVGDEHLPDSAFIVVTAGGRSYTFTATGSDGARSTRRASSSRRRPARSRPTSTEVGDPESASSSTPST